MRRAFFQSQHANSRHSALQTLSDVEQGRAIQKRIGREHERGIHEFTSQLHLLQRTTGVQHEYVRDISVLAHGHIGNARGRFTSPTERPRYIRCSPRWSMNNRARFVPYVRVRRMRVHPCLDTRALRCVPQRMIHTHGSNLVICVNLYDHVCTHIYACHFILCCEYHTDGNVFKMILHDALYE